MPTLILIRLDCAATEDYFGDEIRVEVNGSAVWRGSFDENDRKSLDNKAVPFENSAAIRLMEEDWPDGDDHLGTVNVPAGDTAAVSRAARFTLDEADYTLWYSVYGDVPPPPPPTLPPYGPPQPADPPNQPPVPGQPAQPGQPAIPCALCHLIVEVRDPVASKPVEGAGVRVTARGLSGVTGPDGKVDLGVTVPGDVTVEAWKEQYFPFPATAPASLPADASGPTTVTLYLSPEKVIEVLPGDLKWYVNMDPAEAAHHGRHVTIRARISTRTSGVRVHFRLDADPNNRTGLSASAQASVSPAAALTNNDGVAETKLTLGTYGGDRFRVSASLNPGTAPGAEGAKESGWQTVWRKAYYEILQMKKPSGGGYWEMAAGAMGHVVSAMNNVFLELISLGAPRNIDENVQNFDTATAGYDWADGHTTMRGVPWKINYVVIGHACGREEKEIEAPVNTATAPIGPEFRPYDFNGTDPIVSARYRPAAGGSWTDFPAGKVRPLGTNPKKRIQVDFSGTGVNPATTPQRVKVKYIEASPANGWGGSSLHLLICRGTFDEYYAGHDLGPIMGGTCIHEPGHSLGLVMGLGWETSDAAHSSHCQHRGCVMWYKGYIGRPHDFHPPAGIPFTQCCASGVALANGDPGCHTYVRGLDMSRSPMESRWGFPR